MFLAMGKYGKLVLITGFLQSNSFPMGETLFVSVNENLTNNMED